MLKVRLAIAIAVTSMAASVFAAIPVLADTDTSIGPQFQNDAQLADWRQFRGSADHRGWNQSESTLSLANVGDLQILWRASGGFNSSPAVANGIVYNGDADLSAYPAVCRTDGGYCGPLWTGGTGYPDWASPAVGDGMVYMQSGQGLFAFEVGCRDDGGHCNPVWSNPNAAAGYSSPTFANGFLYVGTGSGQLQAYDVEACAAAGGTCAPEWRANLGGEPNSSPAVTEGVAYIGAPDGYLYAFDVHCGTGGGTCSPIWKGNIHAGTESSPAVANGVVYIPNAQGELFAFAVGCGSNGATCDPLWHAQMGRHIHGSPAVADDLVYIGAVRRLYAFAVGCRTDGGTCDPVWRSTKTAIGGEFGSSPAVANGLVFIGTQGKYQQNGRLVAFTAECASSDEVCGPIWRSQLLGGMVNSSPAVAHGMVYVASNGGTFYAFGLPPTP